MSTTQTLLDPTMHSPEVRDFETALRQSVVGQERAVNSLARAYQARGESDRAVQELERAVQELRKVVITYPRGDRVPAALYKEALALAELGQLQLAEARLQFLLDQFPSTEEAAQGKGELARIRKR